MVTKSRSISNRIGIYAGTFDPVHAGHVAFALQAIEVARLNEIVFLPERAPRRKYPTEHYGHRVAMLERALQPHPRMSVLELADKRFTVQRTWPQLQTIFSDAQLVLLVGSDVLTHMAKWPQVETLLGGGELVVGARSDDDVSMIRIFTQTLPVRPRGLHVVQSHAPHVSSTAIRGALHERVHARGLLASVRAYALANWLYISVEKAVAEKI